MLHTVLNVILVILIIAVIVLAVLYFLGNKLQKRQVEQQSMIEAAAQTVSILVIDKKKMKITQTGLPQDGDWPDAKYMRWAKASDRESQDRPQGDDTDLQTSVYSSPSR